MSDCASRLTTITASLALSSMIGVAPVNAQSLPRFTIAVSGGYQPTMTTFDDNFTFALHQETASTGTRYPIESGSLFDGGFSIRLWRGLGIGVALSHFIVDGTVHATASVPHQFFLQRYRQISGDAGGMQRQEKAVHMQVQYLLPSFGKLQVTLVGGPSVLDINQTVVTKVNYTEQYPYDTAAFSGVDSRRVTGTKTCFNAGADARWMFAKRLGAGALVRYTRATIDLHVGDRTIEVEAGGAQAAAGIRIVF